MFGASPPLFLRRFVTEHIQRTSPTLYSTLLDTLLFNFLRLYNSHLPEQHPRGSAACQLTEVCCAREHMLTGTSGYSY